MPKSHLSEEEKTNEPSHPNEILLRQAYALGVKREAAENSVIFDFRLFAGLATVIVVLIFVRSVTQFEETNSRVANAH